MDETTTTVVHEVPEGVAVPEVPGYRVTRWVGRGSTAHVWRARRVGDDSLVALKVLDTAAEEAALREYAVLAESAVEHAVTLHDCLTIDGGERTVLVLDWMAGGSLGDVIRARGFLSAGEVVTVVSPLATALGQLHRLGVVHGDVSVGNVLLDSTGRPVWSDLGCSRLVGVDPAELDPWGTEGFVAPEIVLGRPPSASGDVYGLGAIAWACLTGSAPGHPATRGSLRELTAGVPDALVDLVEACLEADPVRRPDVDDLARQVFEAASAEPLTVVVPDDISSTMTRRIREAAASASEGEVPFWEQEVQDEPARRWWPWRREAPIDLTRDVSPPARSSLDGPTTVVQRLRTPESPPRGGAHGAGVDRSGLRPWLLAAAVLVVGLVLTTLVPWDRFAAADPTGPVATPAVSGDSPDPAPAAVPTEDEPPVLLDPEAGRDRPAELLAALADARAVVLTEQDRDGLRELTVSGSPAEAADAELLDELEEGGYRYAGLAYRVTSVGAVETTGEDVVLRGRIGMSSYTVGEEGSEVRQQRPEEPGEQVDVRIVHDGGRWRIAEISTP